MEQKIEVWGHRGGYKPENTLKSFQSAIDNKLDGVEFDIWLTSDDDIVIIHGGLDGELVVGQSGDYIFDHTVEELQEVQLGEGQTIPTFRELLDLNKKTLFLDIEIKIPTNLDLKTKYRMEKLVDQLLKLVEEYDLADRSMISSFDFDVLKILKERDAKVPIGYLFESPDQIPEGIAKGDYVLARADYSQSEYIEKAHADGFKFGVWAFKEFEETEEFYQQMKEKNVDCVIGDFPNLGLKAYGRE
mmetsp:Transcript_2018/g.2110  ORF Transcript_2018/g.2110 Transcript_2018/m.2110 type:complete len:245 (+) Transcript_2018:32-766(+)